MRGDDASLAPYQLAHYFHAYLERYGQLRLECASRTNKIGFPDPCQKDYNPSMRLDVHLYIMHLGLMHQVRHFITA